MRSPCSHRDLNSDRCLEEQHDYRYTMGAFVYARFRILALASPHHSDAVGVSATHGFTRPEMEPWGSDPRSPAHLGFDRFHWSDHRELNPGSLLCMMVAFLVGLSHQLYHGYRTRARLWFMRDERQICLRGDRSCPTNEGQLYFRCDYSHMNNVRKGRATIIPVLVLCVHCNLIHHILIRFTSIYIFLLNAFYQSKSNDHTKPYLYFCV